MKSKTIPCIIILLMLISLLTGCVVGPGMESVVGTDDVKFKMIFVPAKIFPTGEKDDGVAVVEYNYWIGETEVTYELFNTVSAWALNNGYKIGIGTKDTYDLAPPIFVSWRQCMVWCNALTEYYNANNEFDLDCVYYSDEACTTPIRVDDGEWNVLYETPGGLDNPYVKKNAGGFRLPGNLEWELAARYIADTNNDGDILDPGEYYPGSFASGASEAIGDNTETKKVAWTMYDGIRSFQPVASKTANALGIFDMTGNAYEWCFDWYPSSLVKERITRGGSYYDSTTLGYIHGYGPYKCHFCLSFRIVRSFGFNGF